MAKSGNKMERIKKIITPLIFIMIFLSMAIGGTYALFTSSDETNVIVSSSKVQLDTVLNGIVCTTTEAIDSPDFNYIDKGKTEATFENGGTTSMNGKDLNVSLMTPLDRVTYQMTFLNQSNINVKFRIFITTVNDDEKLLSAMKVALAQPDSAHASLNDAEKTYNNVYLDGATENFDISGTGTYVSTDWISIPKDDTKIESYDYDLVMYLPRDVGNEYQDLNANFVFTVYAIQANAADDIVVNDATLRKALAEKTEFKLDADITLGAFLDEKDMPLDNYVIDLNGYSIRTPEEFWWYIPVGKTVTFIDTSDSGDGEIVSTANAALRIAGTVNLNGGCLTTSGAEGTDYGVWVDAGGVLNVGADASISGARAFTNQGTINLNGGRIDSVMSLYNMGTVTVSGGDIVIASGSFINYNRLTMTGGALTVTDFECTVLINMAIAGGNYSVSGDAAINGTVLDIIT